MEDTLPAIPAFSLKRFLLRSVLPNAAVTLAFVVILFWCKTAYEQTTATRTNFLANLIALPVCWTHTLLLLIFSVRRFVKRQVTAGLSFLLHAFFSASVGYWLYLILALYGWAYAMKGH